MTDLWTMPSAADAHEDPEAYAARQAERDSWFKKIQPPGNWKEPISARIDPADFEQCNQACIWFTGAPLTRHQVSTGKLWVTSPGYYATIGA